MGLSDVDLLLRLAGRALGRAGLVHAYGHCSVRLDDDHLRVTPSVPLGCIPIGAPGITVPLDGPLPDGVLGEVRIHQRLYRARPEVGAVCRVQPPDIMTLSTLARTPRPLHGFGAYFAPCPPLWSDPRLVRDDGLAVRCVDTLGAAPAIVLRANGAVTVGEGLEQAVVLAWYLEDAARVELAALATGLEPVVLTAEECRDRATWGGGLIERMWRHLTDGDPELPDPEPPGVGVAGPGLTATNAGPQGAAADGDPSPPAGAGFPGPEAATGKENRGRPSAPQAGNVSEVLR